MANLDNITASILQDARDEADRILQESQDKADQKRETRLDALKKEHDQLLDKRDLIKGQIEEEIQTGAQNEARNMLLAAKQKVIDRVFNLAKQDLADMDDESYKDFLDHFLTQTKPGPDVVLEIPSKRNFQSKAVQVKKSDRVQSGFILVKGGVRVNYDFDTVVDSLRERMDTEILETIQER